MNQSPYRYTLTYLLLITIAIVGVFYSARYWLLHGVPVEEIVHPTLHEQEQICASGKYNIVIGDYICKPLKHGAWKMIPRRVK